MNAVVTTERNALSPVQNDAAAVMDLITRAASDQSVDIDKLERLMQMHQLMSARQSETTFNEAMSAAQAEMRPISADATNPQTRSKYATYGRLDSAVRPIYTRHGFGLSFDTGDARNPDEVRVLCYVTHRGGHARTYKVDMPADGKGAKGGDVMTRTHAMGAGMSYGQRYLLKLVFNIAVGENDNDGNDTRTGFDTTDWRIKIDDCTTKAELDVVGEELKNAKGIPVPAMTELRRCWGQKARLIK